MLHQFNYATPLSQFLSLHQSLQSQSQQTATLSGNDNSSSSILSPNSLYDDLQNNSFIDPRFHGKDHPSNNKSFTIAAILGLHQDHHQNGCHVLPTADSPTDLSEVMNLSVHSGVAKAPLTTASDGGVAAGAAVGIVSGGGGGGPGGGASSVTDATRAAHPSSGLFGGHAGASLSSSARSVSNPAALAAHQHQHPQQFNTATTSPSGSLTHQRSTERSNLKHISGLGGGGGGGGGSSKKSAKSKRVRTIFTPEQLERLEAEFERQQYMVGPERLYLAHTLQLTEAQVKVWFQNRRIKWRKHHLELTHQRLAVIKQQQQQLQHQLLQETENTLDSSSSSPEET